jgi:NADPH:quinone reductase-like Zn-dependent oxidoreductase
MKAVVYRRYGGPEVLEYTDVPDPKFAQNSMLVRVRAAALNPADHLLQAGLGESHTDAWFPVIPGWDVAGVVRAVAAQLALAREAHVIGSVGRVLSRQLHRGDLSGLVRHRVRAQPTE